MNNHLLKNKKHGDEWKIIHQRTLRQKDWVVNETFPFNAYVGAFLTRGDSS